MTDMIHTPGAPWGDWAPRPDASNGGLGPQPAGAYRYQFHVELWHSDRATAKAAVEAALSCYQHRHVVVSEHTASLIDAIEERGVLDELRAIVRDYVDGARTGSVDQAADAFDELAAALRGRIAELADA